MKIIEERLKTFVPKQGFVSKVESFKMTNKYNKKGGIVFLGDSITQAFNVYEYFSDNLVYNRGIGGDDTVSVFSRLDESVFDLEPSKVVILLGTNDLTHFKEDTAFDIASRIELLIKSILKNSNAKIYLQSIYPVNMDMEGRTCEFRDNNLINDINSKLKEIENITYIDIHNKLLDGNCLKEEYTFDGVHITDLAYDVISQELKKYILE